MKKKGSKKNRRVSIKSECEGDIDDDTEIQNADNEEEDED